MSAVLHTFTRRLSKTTYAVDESYQRLIDKSSRTVISVLGQFGYRTILVLHSFATLVKLVGKQIIELITQIVRRHILPRNLAM